MHMCGLYTPVVYDCSTQITTSAQTRVAAGHTNHRRARPQYGCDVTLTVLEIDLLHRHSRQMTGSTHRRTHVALRSTLCRRPQHTPTPSSPIDHSRRRPFTHSARRRRAERHAIRLPPCYTHLHVSCAQQVFWISMLRTRAAMLTQRPATRRTVHRPHVRLTMFERMLVRGLFMDTLYTRIKHTTADHTSSWSQQSVAAAISIDRCGPLQRRPVDASPRPDSTCCIHTTGQ